MGKLIRKYRNDSFSHYLTKVRMEKATSLMREKPQLYIKDIAEMVGYSGPALFQQDIPILHGNVPFRLYGRHGGRLSSPELLWSTPVFFFKQFIKIVHVLKAGGRSCLGDRDGGVFEQHGRMLQFQLQDDRDKRLSRIFFQQAAQVIGRKNETLLRLSPESDPCNCG